MALDVPPVQHTPELKIAILVVLQTTALQAKWPTLKEDVFLVQQVKHQLQTEETAEPFLRHVTPDKSGMLMVWAAIIALTSHGLRTATLPVLQMLVLLTRSPPKPVIASPALQALHHLQMEEPASQSQLYPAAMPDRYFLLMVDTVCHAKTTLGPLPTAEHVLLTHAEPIKSWPKPEHVLPALLVLSLMAPEQRASWLFQHVPEPEKLLQLTEEDVKDVHHTPKPKAETHTVLLMPAQLLRSSSHQEVVHAATQAPLLMPLKEIASET